MRSYCEGFDLSTVEHKAGSIADGSWLVDGVSVNLFHAAKIADDSVKKNKTGGLGSFFGGFGKKKYLSWFYSVVSDHVLIKAGNLVIKSSIHIVDKNIKFIRVPRLGNVLVENNILRKPMSGEDMLIKKYLEKKK